MGTTSNLIAVLTEEQRHSLGDLREAEVDAKDRVRRLFELLPDPILSMDEVVELLDAKTKARKAVEGAVTDLVAENYLEVGHGTVKPFAGMESLFRKRAAELGKLRVVALETLVRPVSSEEPPGVTSRFQFSIEGRLVRSIAKIDRLVVLEGGEASGTQREEIKRHVDDIRKGVEGGTEIDNAILIALPTDAVAFDPSEGEELQDEIIVFRGRSNWSSKTVSGLNGEPVELQRVRLVEIEFPFRNAMFDSEKSAILVDGQQRTAGMLLASFEKRPAISVAVNLIIGDEGRAKSSFLVSNSTVPIKKDLLSALVADLDSEFVPGNLTKDELPARVVKSLALDEGVFKSLVNYSGLHRDTRPPIAYQTMRAVVDTFLSSPALKEAADSNNVAIIRGVIDTAFEEVRKVWPKAWGLPPKESRLMHGAGLRVVANYVANDILKALPTPIENLSAFGQVVAACMQKLRPRIVWSKAEFDNATAAAKDFYLTKLDTLENTGKSIKSLQSAFDFEVYKAQQN